MPGRLERAALGFPPACSYRHAACYFAGAYGVVGLRGLGLHGWSWAQLLPERRGFASRTPSLCANGALPVPCGSKL